MSTHVGRFIVVEGIDGSGKTTQAGHLVSRLKRDSRAVLETMSPSSWYRNQPVVKSFIDTGETTMSVNTLAALAATDRMMELDHHIIPAIQSGSDVVCTRYIYSTFGYFKKRGADMSYVEAVNALALRPTHGILLKLPPEHVAERVQGRDVRRTFEERADYLADVQEEMIRRWPADFLLVDATDPVEEVAAQIYRYVTS